MAAGNGFCQCGCGAQTNISARTDLRYGYIKGEPMLYLKNHSRRGKVTSAETRERLRQSQLGKVRENASYRALHNYLNAHHPKSGICQKCARAGKTDYALIPGREHSRDRSDYEELCHRCHMKQDLSGPKTDETRRRMSEGKKRSWARKKADK